MCGDSYLEPVNNRHGIRQRFSTSGLRFDQGIFSAQDNRDGFRLNQGKRLHTLFKQSFRQVRMNSRIREGPEGEDVLFLGCGAGQL